MSRYETELNHVNRTNLTPCLQGKGVIRECIPSTDAARSCLFTTSGSMHGE